MDEATDPIRDAAAAISDEYQADIFIYCSDISRHRAEQFIDMLRDKQHRKNKCILFLTTNGGDPDAAYLIAKILRKYYEKISVIICSVCKSAGTLICIGADELYIGDTGELGPLDIQLSKRDEIANLASGLDLLNALNFTQAAVWQSFEQIMITLVARSGGSISTKTAAQIASTISVNLHSPIIAQIDPDRLGEVQRAMQIGEQYGARLNSGNLRPDALQKLVYDYPAHSFVIDQQEAKELFFNVMPLDGRLGELARILRERLRDPQASRPPIDMLYDIEKLYRADPEGPQEE